MKKTTTKNCRRPLTMVAFFMFIQIVFTASLLAQPTNFRWKTSLGSAEDDVLRGMTTNLGLIEGMSQSLAPTPDGGCIIAGSSKGNDGDVTGHHGLVALSSDIWIVKLDSNGYIEWQRSLGGSRNDEAGAVIATYDGGYMVAGGSNSWDGDVGVHYGDTISPLIFDGWLVKLDVNGNIQWSQVYGGSGHDFITSILQTSDYGYVFTAWTNSNDSDVVGLHIDTASSSLQRDMWVVKISSTGAIQWQKCLGGTKADTPANIEATSDGGYVIGGSVNSNDGDVQNPQNIGGGSRTWIAKLDSVGTIQWQYVDGGPFFSTGRCVRETAKGNFILFGSTSGNAGNVIDHNGGFQDFWVQYYSPTGTQLWQKCFGSSGIDPGLWAEPTPDGNFILFGASTVADSNVTSNYGGGDIWMIKVDTLGNIEWEKNFGGTGDETGMIIRQTPELDYIFAGISKSNDNDVSGHHGPTTTYDIWVAKLYYESFDVQEDLLNSADVMVFPNPASSVLNLAITSKRNSSVTITASDISGRTIAKLYNGALSIGENRIECRLGDTLSNGLYFITVQGEDFSITEKITIRK